MTARIKCSILKMDSLKICIQTWLLTIPWLSRSSAADIDSFSLLPILQMDSWAPPSGQVSWGKTEDNNHLNVSALAPKDTDPPCICPITELTPYLPLKILLMNNGLSPCSEPFPPSKVKPTPPAPFFSSTLNKVPDSSTANRQTYSK